MRRAGLVSLLLLTVCCTTQAAPSSTLKIGTYVSECSKGRKCEAAEDALGANVTTTTLDGVTYCCFAGNTISLQLRMRAEGYNESIYSASFSSDSLNGSLVGSGVSYLSSIAEDVFSDGESLGNETADGLADAVGPWARMKDAIKVTCECREISEEDVEEYVEGVSTKVWNAVQGAWNRVSSFF